MRNNSISPQKKKTIQNYDCCCMENIEGSIENIILAHRPENILLYSKIVNIIHCNAMNWFQFNSPSHKLVTIHTYSSPNDCLAQMFVSIVYYCWLYGINIDVYSKGSLVQFIYDFY